MKKFSTIFIAAAIATASALPAFAGPADTSGNANPQADRATIAQLSEAAQNAQREARQNKNNLVFQRKNYEINQLIERMKNGQKVDPADLDKALEPARVW